MITTDEALAYLTELGLTLPTTIIECLIAKAETATPCMVEAGYSDCDQKLALLYLVGMLSISSGGRRIRSQGAPSGASRSFDYGSLTDQMRQLRNALQIIDPAGCTGALQPSEPSGRAALFIGRPPCQA